MLKIQSTWSIGRHNRGKFVHAFDVQRKDDGGIRILNISELSDEERFLVYSHFGTSILGNTGSELPGGGHVTIRDRKPPGSVENFIRAVYEMPVPFEWMAPAQKAVAEKGR